MTCHDRNSKLCTIIQKIAEGLNEFSTDIDALGDAYEYLIGQFAAGSGKKAGEPERAGDGQPQAARRANEVRQFYTRKEHRPLHQHGGG